MVRKLVLAGIAAASLVGLAGVSTPASAEYWSGPRYGYGGDHRGYGPPPWVVRKWAWRRHHHHFGPPAYYAPRERSWHGRHGPYRPHW